jgi:hypothetical protein
MSELTLTGRLHKIFDTNQISDSFKKRDFVIETEDQYPQMVKFELTQNTCDKINDFKVGDEITAHFNVRGREWTNKNNEVVYFVSLNAWRIEKVGNAPASVSTASEIPADDSDSDLPF